MDIRRYCFVFLLNEENELTKLRNLITSVQGKIIKEEDWGEKKLAYPIKKQTKAHYYQWLLDIPAKKMKELKKKLEYNEKIIRYLILLS